MSSKLTDVEQKELERLLAKSAKAKSMALPPGPSCYDAENALVIDPTTGATYPLYEDGCCAAADYGAMSDASKRRDEWTDVQTGSKRTNMATGRPVTQAYATASADIPFVFTGSNSLPNTGVPSMPEGIEDIGTWGKTLIRFGQYKHSGLCYADLVESEDDRAKSYVKWCKSHTNTAQGHLRDFCQYLRYLRHVSEGPEVESQLIIPGTSDKRVFKA